MIYVSANGKVLGEFEESAIPALLAEGKVTGDAYYWREGMKDWLPVARLPKPSAAGGETVRLPEVARAPVIVALRTPVAAPGAEAVPVKPSVPVKPALASFGPGGTKSFTPRSAPKTDAAPGAAKPEGASDVVGDPAFVIPLRAESQKAAPPDQASLAVEAPVVAPEAAPVPVKPALASFGPGGTKSFTPRSAPTTDTAPGAAKPEGASEVVGDPAFVIPLRAESEKTAPPDQAPVAVKVPVVAPGAAAVPIKPPGIRPALAPFGAPGTKSFTPRSAPAAGPALVAAKPGEAGAVAAKRAFAMPLRAEAEKAAPPPQAPVAVALKLPAQVPVAVKAPVAAVGTETVAIKPAVVQAAPAAIGSPETKVFIPRRTPVTGAAPTVAKPVAPDDAATNDAAATKVAPVIPLQPEQGEALPLAGAPKKRGRLVSWLAGLLVVAGVAGGGAWWWLNAAPASIPGSVLLSGDEVEAVEIRVFRREDLSGLWRERLAAADARSVELDQLMVGAQAAQRENELLLEVAARVFEVGQEYNMPDLEELRAERDAKEAGAASARAALETLQSEKAALPNIQTLLEGLPDPLQALTADAEGNFTLPRPEGGEVVLLAVAVSETDGKRERRGWLEIMQLSPEGEALEAVRFTETNRLGVEEIRRFAAEGAL